MKPIVVHPRMDFMLYAIDQIVNQAAKWSHMFGGNSNNPSLTIRAMINRGGDKVPNILKLYIPGSHIYQAQEL